MSIKVTLTPEQDAKLDSGEWVSLALVVIAPREDRLHFLISDSHNTEEVVAVLKKFRVLGKDGVWIGKKGASE